MIHGGAQLRLAAAWAPGRGRWSAWRETGARQGRLKDCSAKMITVFVYEFWNISLHALHLYAMNVM